MNGLDLLVIPNGSGGSTELDNWKSAVNAGTKFGVYRLHRMLRCTIIDAPLLEFTASIWSGILR
jgi:hypothetical protein